MKVSDRLEKRRQHWQELQELTDRMEWRRGRLTSAELSRFAALYRAACADLALADAYQLPPNTVQYLHRLVGRAHNQLYRTRNFDFAAWRRMLLVQVPQRIFHDRCVQLAFVLFWGVFLLSAGLCYQNRQFAEEIMGQKFLTYLQDSFSGPIGEGHPATSFAAAMYYIEHNTGIGLQCFASGLLVVPGLAVTVFNAAFLGAAFGFMARPDVPQSPNFFHFVTAHGPFELTAIVLSAGAGLRLGMAWISTVITRSEAAIDRVLQPVTGASAAQLTGVFTRESSLRHTATKTMPVMGAAIIMFFMAALIEGFLSPSAAPYWTKAATAIISSGLLVFYFVVLGFPRR